MKDIFTWLCGKNIIPCAVFRDGIEYQVNALFKNFLATTNSTIQKKMKSLIKKSQSQLTTALSHPLYKYDVWQVLTAISIKQDDSVYTMLLLEPNSNFVEHVTTFLRAVSSSPVMIMNEKAEILYCNKPEFGKLERTHPQQWERIKKIVQKNFTKRITVQEDLPIDDRLYRITAMPEYDDVLIIFKDITSQKLAEERYQQLRIFSLRFSLLERIMNALTEERTDLRSIGKIIYEETRKVVPIDTFYFALINDDFIVIEYGVNQGTEITGLKIKRGYVGLSNYVIDKGEFTYIPNTKTARLDPYKPIAITKGETRYIWSYVGIPLKIGAKVVGAASFQKRAANAFTQSHLAFFELIGKEISVAIRMRALFDELEAQRLRYKEIAMKDPLTGCYTRYYFAEYFERFQGIIERKGGEICFVMVDVDNFKSINDRFGHIVGDTILKEIGNLLMKNVRKMDLVVRYGGDEFLLMLPYVTLRRAGLIMQRISKKVSELNIPECSEKITLSYGISVYDGSKSLEEILKIADERMYKWKKEAKV